MSKTPLLYSILRPIGIFLLKVIYNLKIINKEYIPKEGRVVLAGNHKFYFDPLSVDIATKRCVHAMCWYTYYYKAEWLFKNVGTICVEKTNGQKSLDKAIEYLNNDEIINISPEGSMNTTNEILLPFRKGAILMAQATNSKIIPYSITGDYKFRSKNLKICFGQPLDVSNMSFEDANKLLYDTVKELILINKD